MKLHATTFYHPRSQNFRTELKGTHFKDFEGLNHFKQNRSSKFKRRAEEYVKKRRLRWHFRNDEKPFSQERLKPKFTVVPRNKVVVIVTYPSCFHERLVDIEIPFKRFNNLTEDEKKQCAV